MFKALLIKEGLSLVGGWIKRKSENRKMPSKRKIVAVGILSLISVAADPYVAIDVKDATEGIVIEVFISNEIIETLGEN